MAFHKIINDPIYGFITIPSPFFIKLIDHPFFQRLRRIKQGGFSHLIYPGAMHNRFHHALGAFHLAKLALHTLRAKGISISLDEEEGLLTAILLHDIGHGPYSHTLENQFLQVDHENLTRIFMDLLKREFGDKLTLAIDIFQDNYKTPFFYQLISGQLDLDRMDYLTRDSFYTGVVEGVIGYDRIIKMLNVIEGKLVVEEKGIYSIEKFLMARRLMYWQVYYHKAVVSAEQMLLAYMHRLRTFVQGGGDMELSRSLRYFLQEYPGMDELNARPAEIMRKFAILDDSDLLLALKNSMNCPDPALSFLSKGLIQRKLFRVEFSSQPFEKSYCDNVIDRVSHAHGFDPELAARMIFNGKVRNLHYSESEEIQVLTKKKEVKPLSAISDGYYHAITVEKHFLCYPKLGDGSTSF